MVMASLGHFLAHRVQPMQPIWQALRVSAPFWVLLQLIKTYCLAGTISIRCLGQAAAQAPQATHLSMSTTALPSTTWMASNLQAATQEP